MIKREQINKLPDTPGVYFFKDALGNILYIGKATSLRDRVKSYLSSDLVLTRGQLLVNMVAQSVSVDVQTTDSVLEALILEAYLIKKHQPQANTKDKDNKSFNFVLITAEEFPRVLLIRGRELEKQQQEGTLPRTSHIFGPFPFGGSLKEALKIIRKIFPYRDKCVPHSGKPCFNSQIGLCPGVCIDAISKQEYKKIIKNIVLFFEGEKKKVIKNLEKEMSAYAKAREFEKAAVIRGRLFGLRHIQDVALIKEDRNEKALGFRIEAYDIAHLAGTSVVGVMTVIENGEINKNEYRKFNIKINPGINDIAALKEVLRRRFTHTEWNDPSLIVVDGAQAQINACELVLKEVEKDIPVVSVVKDERHRPKNILGDQKIWLPHERDILLANSEAHRFAIAFHRKKRKVV